MHQMRLLSASLVLAFGLAACGGSDSTSAPAVPVASASSGVLVDDLIAGATVFCDDNSNGVLDAGEKSAVTDSAGAYAFSSACSSQIASVAETGYDLTTLKAPKGQFIAPASRRSGPATAGAGAVGRRRSHNSTSRARVVMPPSRWLVTITGLRSFVTVSMPSRA